MSEYTCEGIDLLIVLYQPIVPLSLIIPGPKTFPTVAPSQIQPDLRCYQSLIIPPYLSFSLPYPSPCQLHTPERGPYAYIVSVDKQAVRWLPSPSSLFLQTHLVWLVSNLSLLWPSRDHGKTRDVGNFSPHSSTCALFSSSKTTDSPMVSAMKRALLSPPLLSKTEKMEEARRVTESFLLLFLVVHY